MARRGSAGMGYGQAFLLAFGFLVASVLIFLFGMWVGRDLTERRLTEEPVVRMTVPARPTAGGPTEGVGREFYDGLKTRAYQQLQTPTAEPPPVPSATAALPTAASTSTKTMPTRALPTSARPAVNPTPPRPAASPKAAPTTDGESFQGQMWTVQVGATMDSREALDITLRLRAQGFAAYTVQAPLRGQTWFRVRVGRFASREEAREVEARLRQTGEFKGAYVTSQ